MIIKPEVLLKSYIKHVKTPQYKNRGVTTVVFAAQHWFPSLLRAEVEAKLTSEKEEEIKMVEAEILQLKADIYNLKVLPTFLET